MPNSRRWRMVRVPETLAQRLERLAEAMERAYGEGRLSLPGEYAERVPLHLVIESALNEVEARRARSNRPRAKQSQS